jgi:hypothetical protein
LWLVTEATLILQSGEFLFLFCDAVLHTVKYFVPVTVTVRFLFVLNCDFIHCLYICKICSLTLREE